VVLMNKVTGLINLIRPVNSAMMGLAVIVGIWVAARNLPLNASILGFITAFTLTAASMAINDFYDRDVDAKNEPNRPIPSRIIAPKEALEFSAVLIIIGLSVAFMTDLTGFIVAAAFILLALIYNTKGKEKGLLGNFMVSACIAIPFIYGGLIVGKALYVPLLIFAVLAFFTNTGREVTKGIADLEGDKIRKVRTVAASFGSRAAAQVATIFYTIPVILSAVPLILGVVSFWYLPPVLVVDVGIIASSILLMKNYSRANAKRIKNLVLIWMLVGSIAFIVGG